MINFLENSCSSCVLSKHVKTSSYVTTDFLVVLSGKQFPALRVEEQRMNSHEKCVMWGIFGYKRERK
jgi:hypothetical protein